MPYDPFTRTFSGSVSEHEARERAGALTDPAFQFTAPMASPFRVPPPAAHDDASFVDWAAREAEELRNRAARWRAQAQERDRAGAGQPGTKKAPPPPPPPTEPIGPTMTRRQAADLLGCGLYPPKGVLAERFRYMVLDTHPDRLPTTATEQERAARTAAMVELLEARKALGG